MASPILNKKPYIGEKRADSMLRELKSVLLEDVKDLYSATFESLLDMLLTLKAVANRMQCPSDLESQTGEKPPSSVSKEVVIDCHRDITRCIELTSKQMETLSSHLSRLAYRVERYNVRYRILRVGIRVGIVNLVIAGTLLITFFAIMAVAAVKGSCCGKHPIANESSMLDFLKGAGPVFVVGLIASCESCYSSSCYTSSIHQNNLNIHRRNLRLPEACCCNPGRD